MQIFAKKKKKRGFTLIELLVVIAIIGILASIVLVSLGGARTRAKDTRVITDLNQVRTVGEVINSADGNYLAVLTNADINTLMLDMNNQGAANNTILRTGNADGTGYCVEAQMLGGKWGCVNSGLVARFDLTANPNCAGANNGNATSIACP